MYRPDEFVRSNSATTVRGQLSSSSEFIRGRLLNHLNCNSVSSRDRSLLRGEMSLRYFCQPRLLPIVALVAILICRWSPTAAGAAKAPPPIDWPAGLALSGSDLWVANEGGNSLTEISVRSGSLVRTVGSPAYGFNSPIAIATDGQSLWVANNGGHTITQVNAQSGALIRIIDPGEHRIVNPLCVVYADGEVWVSSGGNVNHNASIVELDPSTGHVVQVLTKGIIAAQSLAVIGQNVWVGNINGSVVELSAKNGRLERVVDLSGLGSGVEPQGFVPFGNDIWIPNGMSTNPGTNYSMVELRPSDGAVVRKVNASSLRIDTTLGDPSTVATDGKYIWMATPSEVVEMSASSGRFENIVRASRTNAISHADGLFVAGHTLWISNGTGGLWGSVTELSLPSGDVIRVIK